MKNLIAIKEMKYLFAAMLILAALVFIIPEMHSKHHKKKTKRSKNGKFSV